MLLTHCGTRMLQEAKFHKKFRKHIRKYVGTRYVGNCRKHNFRNIEDVSDGVYITDHIKQHMYGI